jgi:hypothetical protein
MITMLARPVCSSTCSFDRHAVDEVLELHDAGRFRHDRVGVRVPGRDDLAALDPGAVVTVIAAP